MAAPAALAEQTVVDADVHVTARPEALAAYADQPFRDLFAHGRIFPNPSTWDSTMGGAIEFVERAEAFDAAEAVDAFRERFGIDHPVVNTNPMVNLFSDPEVATAAMRAHNDLLLDRLLDETDGVYGCMAVSLADPEATAEEIDRVGGEADVVGGYLPNAGLAYGPGDERYDVVYEALEDRDLPVVLHANADASVYDFPQQHRALRQYLELHSVVHMWYQSMAIASYVTQGTVEKFPDLRYVVLEAGISWVPYVMYRLNREYAMRKREAPLLRQPPEAYVRDRFFFASQPLAEPMDPDHLTRIIELVGPESLLFASDYPHWDFDHPDALADHLARTFDAEQRRRVLEENPQRAFRLP